MNQNNLVWKIPKYPFKIRVGHFLIRTSQLPKGITHSYKLRIAQTQRLWKYHSKSFPTISGITLTTSGESSCSWRLVIAYKRFVPLPVPKVAPLGAALSGGATEKDWALLPPLPFSCLFFGHSRMKCPVWPHLKQSVETSRHTLE
ncbi:hypothetical protein H5410_030523 [Solanum commersonii]|uniref:Uncharacterized protein n=1 Tax=Solanum commersonii TaxID=4109 RepID=A0A9J5YFX8_SOLCO|nr:hypothetical protein H5410_030523 [Solanum commersonii]